jgi:hypothetical protein
MHMPVLQLGESRDFGIARTAHKFKSNNCAAQLQGSGIRAFFGPSSKLWRAAS